MANKEEEDKEEKGFEGKKVFLEQVNLFYVTLGARIKLSYIDTSFSRENNKNNAERDSHPEVIDSSSEAKGWLYTLEDAGPRNATSALAKSYADWIIIVSTKKDTWSSLWSAVLRSLEVCIIRSWFVTAVALAASRSVQ